MKFMIFLIVVIVGLQFIQPELTNPESDEKNELRAADDVKAVLERACYDCHSNKTIWPWYSNVAPISFLVADHVEEGRSELNFSEWRTYPAKKKRKKMAEIWEEIEEGEMPMKGYAIVHDVELSAEEKALIKDWSEKLVIF